MPQQTVKLAWFAGVGLGALMLVFFLSINKLSLQLVSHRFDFPGTILPPTWGPMSDQDVARGHHLAHGILGCSGCHGQNLAGRLLWHDSARATIASANLTMAGGAGGAGSDEPWVLALRYGLRDDGRALWLMPQRALGHLSDGDLHALVAYLRQLQPQEAEAPVPRLGMLGRIEVAIGRLSLFDMQPLAGNRPSTDAPSEVQVAPTAAYGAYLARVGRCTSCHGDTPAHGHPGRLPWLAGGPLTAAAMGRVNAGQLGTALVEGRHLDGTFLPEQVQGHRFAQLDATEAAALWAFYVQAEPVRAAAASSGAR